MLNKIVIMGRLTRDPELRRTQTGTAVTTFTLAVDRDFKSQSGEREADFIDCVAWRNSAEFVTRYFTKGRMAVVEGRLQSRKWQDKDGNNRTSWEIQTDNIYFGDSQRREGESGGQQPYGSGGSYSGSSGYGGGYSGQGGYSAGQGGYQSGRGPATPAASKGDEYVELGVDDGELPF